MLDTQKSTHARRGLSVTHRNSARERQSAELKRAWAKLHPEQKLSLFLLTYHSCDDNTRAALLVGAQHEASNAHIFRP